jgi:hypothetical protein
VVFQADPTVIWLLEKRRGEVEPQAPLRTVIATGDKTSVKKMASGGGKPRIVADGRIGANVTISVVPRTRV